MLILSLPILACTDTCPYAAVSVSTDILPASDSSWTSWSLIVPVWPSLSNGITYSCFLAIPAIIPICLHLILISSMSWYSVTLSTASASASRASACILSIISSAAFLSPAASRSLPASFNTSEEFSPFILLLPDNAGEFQPYCIICCIALIIPTEAFMSNLPSSAIILSSASAACATALR